MPYTRAVSVEPQAPASRPRSATPRSPATRDLGMKATLLFPTREIAERTTCRSSTRPAGPATASSSRRTSSSAPRAAVSPASGSRTSCVASSSRATAPPSSTSSSPSPSAASAGRSPISSCAIARAWPSTSSRSATSTTRRPATWCPGSVERCRSCAARALHRPAGRLARRLRGDAGGRHPRRGCPLRHAQRHAHEPRHDHEPARAHPHVGAASLHDGAVGDPSALPAHPPRGLLGEPVPGLVPGPQVRAAGLLRRGPQPRRALPHPTPQGQRPGRLGGEARRRQGRWSGAADACRPSAASTAIRAGWESARRRRRDRRHVSGVPRRSGR